ncbi:MAG: YceI family protein [Bernardetiaceae bacterium]|nr:YceI family protein [Bernardetiaceae bacterium]
MNQTKWNIDPMHSEIIFKVKHLVISTVTGRFNEFEGSLTAADKNFSDARATFSAKTATIDTGNSQRDEHLRSNDFFNAAEFPTLTFTSEKFEKVADKQYKMTGTLQIRETSQSITLDVELGGIAQDPYGNTKAGFEISGKINRKDFGLQWGAVTEAGSVVVGEEVRLQLNVQLAKSE